MRMRSRIAAAIAAAALAVTLVPAATISPAAADTEIVALVASNAKGAFEEIIKEFESKHKGVTIKAQYLGGSTIAKMVDENQPADFILVGEKPIAKEAPLLADPPTPVLKNKEIILVPKGNPAKIKSLKDIANPGVKLSMGTPSSAVGSIASTVLQNGASEYGFDFIQNARKNIAVQEEKGSDVVAALTNGKANAAITFASDDDPSKFDAVQIEDKLNVVSTYVMAVPKASKNQAVAKEIVAFVAGPEGQAVLKKFRYMSPK